MTQFLRAQILIDPRLVTTERMQDLIERLDFAQPLLQEIGEILEEALAENFDTQGYGQWAPLTDGTLLEKTRRGYGSQPALYRTGHLREALTQQDAMGHKFLVGQNSVDVGFYPDMVPYGERLAEGDPVRHLPARVLIQVGPNMRDKIVQAIQMWLGGGEAVRVTLNAYAA